MAEAVEEKKVGRNRQLTERDRELCGFLAVCRYLSREQIERLMFPGRSKARSSTRLRQLASSEGQAAVLRGDLGFIELETGSATVFDAKKTTSTLAKVRRYSHFFNDPAGTLFNEKDTWYSRAFKEPWPAEVLFVTQTEARRDSIAKLITNAPPSRLVAHALTVSEAQRTLCLALSGQDVPVPVAPRAPRSAPATGVACGPARTADEERMRRGRVSVRGEQLINFEKTMRDCLTALTKAREALVGLRAPPNLIPHPPVDANGVLRVLGEYARRGTLALSRTD